MQLGVRNIIVMIAVIGLLLVYYFFDARNGGFPECPFHLLTGWLCPGCGSQRALSSLLHGNIIEAGHNNVLLVLFLPLLLYSAFVNLRYARKMKLWYHPVFVKLILVSVICFWFLRNLPYYPFSILAPLN